MTFAAILLLCAAGCFQVGAAYVASPLVLGEYSWHRRVIRLPCLPQRILYWIAVFLNYPKCSGTLIYRS